MLDEIDFDELHVAAQNRVDELLEEYDKHFYGRRQNAISSQMGRQLGEPGVEIPRDSEEQLSY